ncbi:MAG: DUF5011 domain-containing protein [Eubacterium sp.]|nr:DUF5011 domain-containing protein [Eubacterium sp.]
MVRFLRVLVVLMICILAAGGVYIWKTMNETRTTPPVLTLLGEKTVELPQDTEYEDPGYEATDATGRDITDRVKVDVPAMDENGTFTVTYTVTDAQGNSASAERTVTRNWSTQTKEGRERGLQILAYHDVYDGMHAPAVHGDDMIANEVLTAELQYFIDNNYYFPSWDEVYDYLSGMIDLPEKSIVITFDGGAEGFRVWGAPIIEGMDMRATVFCETEENLKALKAEKYKHIEIQAASTDLEGFDVYAYPNGSYTDEDKKKVKKAGFRMAFTLDDGKTFPDKDLYSLTRMYIRGNMTFYSFSRLIEGF